MDSSYFTIFSICLYSCCCIIGLIMAAIRCRKWRPGNKSIARNVLCVAGNIVTHYGRHRRGRVHVQIASFTLTPLSWTYRHAQNNAIVTLLTFWRMSYYEQLVQSNICAYTRQSNLYPNSNTSETKTWHEEACSAAALPFCRMCYSPAIFFRYLRLKAL